MLDSNTVLGIPHNLGCTHYKHAIISQNWETWPCSAPIIYSADIHLPDYYGSSISTALLMSANQQGHGRFSYSTPASMIREIDIKPLDGNHKVLTVSKFDLGKFDRLRECIHDVGGVSFIIEDEPGRYDISVALQVIQQKFKYSSLFYYNGWGPKPLADTDDSLICVVTMLDLTYCVPLFNMRKVDGFGVSISAATLSDSKANGILNRIYQTDIVFSNYEDNIFVIDGAVVNSSRPPDSSLYAEMRKMNTQALPIRKGLKKVKKSAKASVHTDLLRHQEDEHGQRQWVTAGRDKIDFEQPSDWKWKREFTPITAVGDAELDEDMEQPSLNEEVEPSEEPVIFETKPGGYVLYRDGQPVTNGGQTITSHTTTDWSNSPNKKDSSDNS